MTPVSPEHRPSESHRSQHTGWLRAAVLGANDGAISTASLVVGVAAANADRTHILLADVAGLAAGAMAMAAGEYVSVSSQADTEKADLNIERKELASDYPGEVEELASLYRDRGVSPDLATAVAEQLMTRDALGAHAREELGITEALAARPVQAAAASAAAFVIGAGLPLIVAYLAPTHRLAMLVTIATLIVLAVLGAAAAAVGGAPRVVGAVRVV
ncbi:MAG TPA: VIT1/CCC1 transporter family protein, partial [Tepidisphaeraceae bacterium]